MSSVLTNDGEKFAFLSGLKQFLGDRGKVLIPCPRLAGCEINLHDLYNKVTALGGYQKVTEKDLWVNLLKEYNFNNISATLSYGLKIIYQRFLEEYERVHYFGDDEGSKKPRFDVSIRFNRRSTAFISDYERRQHGLSTSYRDRTTPSRSNYERLAFSLISCLPNEVDFAINACTLLSGESRHVLRLSRCPHVLEALLLHAGVVSEDLGSLSGIANAWLKQTEHDLIKFWQNTVDDDKVLNDMLYVSALCCCANSEITENKSVGGNEPASNLCSVCCLPKSKRHFAREKFSAWSSLFQSTRSSGVQDYEGQRVLQIALVLLNLSFEDFNVGFLARSKPLVRFAFLCVHSTYSALRQTGLDILANISSKMDLLSLGMELVECSYKVIHQCILSPDKFDKIRGYEILGNLCRSPSNKDCVVFAIDTAIYSSSIELLSLGDVELMISALDALYHMSKLGEETCTNIMLIPGSVDTLICLITINVRALGSDHLSKIRIVKRILPSLPSSNEAQPPQNMQGATLVSSHHPPVIQPPIHRHPMPSQVPQHQPQVRHFVPPQAPPPTTHVPPQVAHVLPPTPHVPQQVIRMSQPVIHPQQYVTHVPQQPPLVPPKQPHIPQQKMRVSKLPQVLAQPSHNKQVHVVAQNNPPVNQVPPAPPQPLPTLPQPVPTPQANSTNPPTPMAEKNPPTQTPPSQPQPKNEVQNIKPKVKSKKKEDKKASSASKPSVVPMYTHTESQLAPPVFHYMPAPPSNIVLDKSPASFAQLWVWATYESCGNEEGSTPRVEVFADYAAAATRYGMHGTKQVLPATEFGRCLQQVFPQTAARLFRDEKGQPLYHITGIKKRPTPLPVPGHHPQNAPSLQTPSASPAPTTSSNPCKTCENSIITNTTTTITACSSGANSTTADGAVSTSSSTSQSHSTTKNCTSAPEVNHSENSLKTKDTESKNGDQVLAEGKIVKPPTSSAAEISTETKTTNSLEQSVMVNHCSSVDSNPCNSEIKKSKPEKLQTNHCDVLKSEQVNGEVDCEKIKDDLHVSPVSKHSEKVANSSPSNKNEVIKCNGDLSDEEKVSIKRCSSEEESSRKVSNEQMLVNGEPEEQKIPPLSLPENGHEVKVTPAQQKTPKISPQTSPIAPQKLQKHYDHQQQTTETKKEVSTSKPLAQKRKLEQPLAATINAPPLKIKKTNEQSPNPPPPVIVRQPTFAPVVRPPPVPIPQPTHQNQAPITPTPQPFIPAPIITPQHRGNVPVTSHHRPPAPQIPPAPVPQPPPTPQQMSTKPPVIDLMAPNASLLVLLRNSGKYHFEDSTDEKEDPISKSIRLTAVLILINICLHSNEGRSQLLRHEAWLAYLSMSNMDCSPMIAKLLSEMDR